MKKEYKNIQRCPTICRATEFDCEYYETHIVLTWYFSITIYLLQDWFLNMVILQCGYYGYILQYAY